MPNPIKYSTGSETLALKKGNFYIGTGDVGKGPTSSTGYYNGITPPSGGYTIYLNKETGGPSIYTAANDAQLISLTNSIAGQSYTTANECLVYFAGQTDKMVLNRNYEGIVTDGLVFTMDSQYSPSYPKNGTSVYDLSFSGNNGTLINGVNYSDDTFSFDGANDYIQCSYFSLPHQNHTICVWFKTSSSSDQKILSFSNGCHPIQTINGRMRTCYGDCGVASVTTGVDGNWHMATVIITNSVSRLYIDTSSTILATINVSIGTVSQPGYPTGICRFGAVGAGPEGPTNPFRFFNGNIAICHMYNRSLTLDEVTKNYNTQKGRFGL
jgi:hypothetical protein